MNESFGGNNKNKEKIDKNRRLLIEALGAGFATLLIGLPTVLKKGIAPEKKEGKENLDVENTNPENTEIYEELAQKVEKLKKVLEEVGAREEVKVNSLLLLLQNEFIKNNPEIFPPDIFNEAFFLAIMQKESSFREDAISRSNAVGVMQTKEICVRDTIEGMNRLRRKNPNLFLRGFAEKPDSELANEVLEVVKRS
jgi:hypothetical protein